MDVILLPCYLEALFALCCSAVLLISNMSCQLRSREGIWDQDQHRLVISASRRSAENCRTGGCIQFFLQLPACRMWAGLHLQDLPLGRLHHANIVHVGGDTGDVILSPPPTARLQSRIQQVLPGILLHLQGEGQEGGGGAGHRWDF